MCHLAVARPMQWSRSTYRTPCHSCIRSCLPFHPPSTQSSRRLPLNDEKSAIPRLVRWPRSYATRSVARIRSNVSTMVVCPPLPLQTGRSYCRHRLRCSITLRLYHHGLHNLSHLHSQATCKASILTHNGPMRLLRHRHI